MKRSVRYIPYIVALIVALTVLMHGAPLFSQGIEFARGRSGGTASSINQGFLTGSISYEYRINPGDLLEIFVWKDPDLSRDVRVREDGQFTYPLIGTVKAAGLTVDELQHRVTLALKEFVRYPEVTISVKQAAYSKVVVLGEVYYPGVYPYRGQMDVLTAVGLAGDFNNKAKRESVLVISDNFTGHPKVRRLNVFRSFRHGTIGPDFLLKPNDIVYVPKTFIADFNKSLNDMKPTFDTLAQIMGVRTDIKTIYYNTDRPVKADQDY